MLPAEIATDSAASAADSGPRKAGATNADVSGRVDRTAVFFVASPLHYLAASKVAAQFESSSRCLLIWYDDKVDGLVRPDQWDATLYAPWPRLHPLPGMLGRHRRLLRNVEQVSGLVGHTRELVLHSPVFDTEAINYMLFALTRSSGASQVCARILPDGLLNVQRYPMSVSRRLSQRVRAFRSLGSSRLRYTRFSGDRIGSDAPFVDRIYTLQGFDHQYDPARVVQLGPLATAGSTQSPDGPPRALVVGQPLVSYGLMNEHARAQTSREIADWLTARDIETVHYKAHPRESSQHELAETGYEVLNTTVPLEAHMADNRYDAVAGCCSTALFTARQIYGSDLPIAAFGVQRVSFKGVGKRDNTIKLMHSLNIQIHDTDSPGRDPDA